MRKYSLYLVFLLLISCNFNNTNIAGSGIVCDTNNRPIPNAEIVILCWQDLGFMRDEVTFSKKIFYTDSLGKFNFQFEKRVRLDIAVKANNYSIAVKQLSVKEDLSNINLILTENSLNNCVLYKKRSILSEKKCNEQVVERGFEGFNINQGNNQNNVKNSDLWILNDTLYVKPSGGVIPIMKNQMNLITNYQKAPLEGYKSNYKITGNEAGYFIKTDESKFAKIILYGIDKSEFNKCKEKRFLFHMIYQPDYSHDLLIPHSIDLEQLLLMVY